MIEKTQVKNLINRVGMMLFILAVYILGCTVPVPLARVSATFRHVLAHTSVGIMSFMSGGNFQRLSLFMVGLNPLMIAMLIIQLLTMLRLFYFSFGKISFNFVEIPFIFVVISSISSISPFLPHTFNPCISLYFQNSNHFFFG